MLTLLVSACATVQAPSSGKQAAVCDGLAAHTDALAEAVLVDGGDQSVVAADNLLRTYDAACLQR